MTLILSGTNGVSDVDGTAATPAVRGSDTNTGIFFPAADTIAFAEGGAEVARFDASGNLGVGTSSPGARAEIFNSSGSNILRISRSGTDRLDFYAGSGVSYIDSSPAGGQLAFATVGAERARIDSSGNLLVGTTSQPNPNFTGRFCVVQANANAISTMDATNASGGWGIILRYTASSPNGVGNEAYSFQDSSTVRFQVRSNGGIGNFQANNVNLSDRREKTNFAPAGEYLSKICAIPVQTFNYADQNMEEDPGLTLGVAAQDVQAVAPELVMESDWSAEKDGSKMRLSIYQTDLQYALMKCIQEQQAIIEQLKADVAVLKGQA